jgi:site-specific recombinase XerD
VAGLRRWREKQLIGLVVTQARTIIGAFVDHLEHVRGLSIASRNTLLAAVRSIFRFAAPRHPEHAALNAQVLAVPAKRAQRALVCFLVPGEVDALLASPDRSRWNGLR